MIHRVCGANASAGNAEAERQQTTANAQAIPKLRDRYSTRRTNWSQLEQCDQRHVAHVLLREVVQHIWLELLEKPRENVHKTYRLCSKHFTRDCFTSDACTRLTREAVPSVKVQEPRLRALVHPDFYEEGVAQAIGSAASSQSTAVPVEVMLGHDYLPLPPTVEPATIAGADSDVYDTASVE
ncbi:uncharacterized protein LOC144116054 [Amblyomma americanum]